MKEWAKKFYSGSAWHAVRESFLRSKFYICERCGNPQNPTPATIAHHKEYLTAGNMHDAAVSLSWANLEALCQDCHNREHNGRQDADATLCYVIDADGGMRQSPPSAKKDSDPSAPPFRVRKTAQAARGGCTYAHTRKPN